MIWLGHSSWFVQLGGKRILIDPVLSDYTAPFSFLNKAYEGTSIYRVEDIPEIDCLLISHDHWDHLDYQTVAALKSKVGRVICPLGVGAYFDYWDYPQEKILEGDWYDRISLGEDITVHVMPARHYSGRLLTKNKTLWAGFALETPNRRIFFSGDSGYGPHFARIGEAFQGFDLALLDCGQYDPRWAYIHMTPEEAVQAALDLGVRALIPAHVGRFAIPLMNYIETISPRPILFIMGEKAHSRYFTEDAYKMAAEPKELYIVPGARHIDLYDRTDMIPFDKMTSFFRENL